MLIEYTPVDFTTIEKVELVTFDDIDYIKWRDYIYSKKQLTESQIRRKKEIEQYPEFFNKIKEIFINSSKTCFFCYHRKEDYYKKNNFICWKKYNEEYPCRPGKIELNDYACEEFSYYIPKEKQIELEKINHPNNIFARFYTSNAIQYYLHDLGVWKKEKLPNKQIGINAKQLEKNFKSKLRAIDDIEIIDKLFKIYKNNNQITFKIPDIIFLGNNQYNIIEYKADYGNVQQLKDYYKLLLLAIQQESKMYWIVNNCWSIKELKAKYESEGIFVFLEDDFFNIEFPKFQVGLNAWM